MSVRILPQWLIDLDNGNTKANEKHDSGKNREKKTPIKNKRDNNGDCNPLQNEENVPSTSGSKRVVESPKDKVKGTNLSPGRSRKGGRSVRACLEMSSSEEEIDVKPDLSVLKREVNESPNAVAKQAVLHTCIKEENESIDAATDQIDTDSVAVKREIIEDTPCIEPEAHGEVDKNVESGVNGDFTLGDSDTNVNITNADAATDIVTNPDTSDANADVDTDAGAANGGDNNNQSSATGNTTNNSAQIVRNKCKYGAQCYRKNPQHRQDFSHPEDSDYTTVDNRPECQFGLSCYRKNPLHQQHYKHTKKMQKPRQAKRPKKKAANDSASDDEDEYDLDDPFLDDASSDDYQPSDSDSETDFDAEGEADENDDDGTKQGNQDSKKKKRKRGH